MARIHRKVNALGYVVTPDGRTPDQYHVKAAKAHDAAIAVIENGEAARLERRAARTERRRQRRQSDRLERRLLKAIGQA